MTQNVALNAKCYSFFLLRSIRIFLIQVVVVRELITLLGKLPVFPIGKMGELSDIFFMLYILIVRKLALRSILPILKKNIFHRRFMGRLFWYVCSYQFYGLF